MENRNRQRWQSIADLCRRAGPYLLIELLLPGGTLIALARFVYRRSRREGLPLATTVRDELDRTASALRYWLPTRVAASARAAHPNHDGLEPLAMAPGC
jgi:hypothetical protein